MSPRQWIEESLLLMTKERGHPPKRALTFPALAPRADKLSLEVTALSGYSSSSLQWGRDQLIAKRKCTRKKRMLVHRASMGPRSIDRGKVNDVNTSLFASSLQWGRDQWIAESDLKIHDKLNYPELQWGRNQLIAES